MSVRNSAIAALAALAIFAIAAPVASAHVTASTSGDAVKGGYTVVTFRVPNETEGAETTQLEVKFPQGIAGASVQPVAGWTANVETAKLDEPIKTDDGELTEGVSLIKWSGGKIAPGEFQEFRVSIKLPDEGELGDLLFFPTLQTYSDGEVVKWIEKPATADSTDELDKPSPKLTLVAASEGGDHHAMSAAKDDDTAGDDDAGDDKEAADHDGASQDDVDSARLLGIIGIVLGALGLLLGLIALGRSKRRTS
ncbi:MAG: hypothetical protein JWN72_2318 [Thermoleophilia bacterium]|nr:hypothetical protein [Thermoleophilia bacterium]